MTYTRFDQRQFILEALKQTQQTSKHGRGIRKKALDLMVSIRLGRSISTTSVVRKLMTERVVVAAHVFRQAGGPIGKIIPSFKENEDPMIYLGDHIPPYCKGRADFELLRLVLNRRKQQRRRRA